MYVLSIQIFLDFLPSVQGSVFGPVLNVTTVVGQPPLRLQGFVLVPLVFGESPFFGDVDLLTTWELELGTTESLYDGGLETIAGADAHDGLADAYAGDGALGLAESASHSGLEPKN